MADNYENIRKFSFNNADKIHMSTNVGCYHCCQIYPANLIKDFVDEGTTALCFFCDIDSVLPDSNFILTVPYLKELKKYWFEEKRS